MKNKKANIPITILVIGVVAICGFAIVSFLLSNEKTKNNFASPEVVDQISSFVDEYYFYKDSLEDKDPKKEMEIFEKQLFINHIYIQAGERKEPTEHTYIGGNSSAKTLYVEYRIKN